MVIKNTLRLSLLYLMTGCSTNYVWNTNFDREKIADYFKPSQVELVSQVGNQARLITSLVATRCSMQPPVEEQIYTEIRTELRRRSADAGANRLIIEQCQTYQLTDNKRCPIQSICDGRAFFEED